MKTTWRLPKGVDELLPPAAWELETLRRRVLDLFASCGFEYIDPPVIEYLDALLVGGGEDLDLQTLKVVDQVSGKQLGVRSDMTSQAVRVDAHSRVRDGVQRLSYAGPVVFANPQIAQSSRVPFKAGAEIFGSDSLHADAEVVSLMLAAVEAAGIDAPVLLLGHMGIYLNLIDQIAAECEAQGHQIETKEIFQRIQRKSEADIVELLPDTPLANMLAGLPLLMGDRGVIERARNSLAGAPSGVAQALDQLAELAELIHQNHPSVSLRIDIAELSGYGYHNGPVFAVYHPEHGRALAQGGRYDGIGSEFGRARPATGFDMDLKALLSESSEPGEVIFAPMVAAARRPSLNEFVADLRGQGLRVVQALSVDEAPPSDCRQQVQANNDSWQVVAL